VCAGGRTMLLFIIKKTLLQLMEFNHNFTYETYPATQPVTMLFPKYQYTGMSNNQNAGIFYLSRAFIPNTRDKNFWPTLEYHIVTKRSELSCEIQKGGIMQLKTSNLFTSCSAVLNKIIHPILHFITRLSLTYSQVSSTTVSYAN
jgi:hypothetical protein